MKSFGSATEVLESKGIKTPAFGIDLGTTNSCISVIQSGRTPVVIKLNNGKRTMPSCIIWKGKPGQFEVGAEAFSLRYKPYAAYSAKRLMGTDEMITLKYGTKILQMTPAEVSAEVLKGLVEKAGTQYKDIKSVVITVPAYFDSNQVKQTLIAGELAGLEVLGILREPTSAAIAYGMELFEKDEETVLVYDLGGGTFDISAVRVKKSSTSKDSEFLDLYGIESDDEESGSMLYTVLAVEGDSRLGGDDIDQEMYRLFELKMKAAGIDVTKIPHEEKEKILLRLEKYKKSGIGTYDTTVKFKLKGGTPVKEVIRIEANDFVEAARSVYRKTKKKTQAVLDKVGVDTIGSIILVGGSTKSEAIRSFLARDFPNTNINYALNPDESVAQGAAVRAKELKFGDTSVEVFDVIPLNIGIVSEGRVTPIIRANQRVPYQDTVPFSTVEDNQQRIRITVMETMSSMVEESRMLGEIVLDDIPRGAAGEVTVAVTMSIDSNGQLTCKAKVGGEEKVLPLINVFGKSEARKTFTVNERRIAKWKVLATKLSGEDRTSLEEAISRYEAEEIDLKEISEIVNGFFGKDIKAKDIVLDKPQYL